ncbi:MAG: 3-deoxy-D-manno-octulosonic acid transferase [Proteobacteria bacterium]|nr:3-deoxy-D-manno-octulosonic acid transferase [Pseudomonadota bacterium]
MAGPHQPRAGHRRDLPELSRRRRPRPLGLSATTLPADPGASSRGARVGRAALALYGALGTLATPLIEAHLARRRRQGKEHATRWPERFGVAGRARPAGRVIWLHGASVGEALSALPLIAWLRAQHPGMRLLLTTGTVTSAALVEERLGDAVLHQFVPVDLRRPVRRFLDHWRPDLILWFESELWPILLTEAARRGVPALLINGRMSAASHARWRRARPLVRLLLASFRGMLAWSEVDAARLEDLSGRPVRCAGNLKRAAPALPCDEAELARLRARLAGRPVWVAASTHPGEEAMVGAAHRRLVARHPGLLTVIVPRHPPRGPAIRAALGTALALRSAGDDVPVDAGVYVADTLGELGLWYRLADLALIGGSLVPHGGQNPLEPARLGCAVVLGPHVGNFAEIVAELAAAGAIVALDDEDGLIAAVDRLLADAPQRRAMAAAAQRYAEAEGDVVARIAAELEPVLRPLAPG